MPSTFFGIETALRALSTSQTALDVISNNIANVNTPGYSRQTVNISETDPWPTPDAFSGGLSGQLGSGVTVTSIQRIHDQYLDTQYMNANSQQSYFTAMQNTLNPVQTAFNEPSDNGLNSMISSFFNDFQQLSLDPQSQSAREVVRNQGAALASQFNSLARSLSSVNPQVDQQITADVKQVNQITSQIAVLNKQIRQVTASGQQPNDLEDQRNQLLNQLSGLVNVQVVPDTNGSGQQTGALNVFVSGFAIVQGSSSYNLPTSNSMANGQSVLSDGINSIPVTGGQIGGLMQAKQLSQTYLTNLNSLASSLIQSVNAQHRAGYGLDGINNRNFFAGTDAASISLDSSITANVDAIAAAAPPANGSQPVLGNGDNALAIANLAQATQSSLSNQTFSDYYSGLVGQVGADIQNASTSATNQQQIVQQITTLQQSNSGVNLDEELTNMLSFERSYQAAAKVMTTMDSMLDTLINQMS